jgi:hypothetical protein
MGASPPTAKRASRRRKACRTNNYGSRGRRRYPSTATAEAAAIAISVDDARS